VPAADVPATTSSSAGTGISPRAVSLPPPLLLLLLHLLPDHDAGISGGHVMVIDRPSDSVPMMATAAVDENG